MISIGRSLFHPGYKPAPCWWGAARPGKVHSVGLPGNTEVVVIGSGYPGHTAALELAREGRDIIIVDALAYGEEASSHNGGGASAGVNIGKVISGGPGQSGRGGSIL